MFAPSTVKLWPTFSSPGRKTLPEKLGAGSRATSAANARLPIWRWSGSRGAGAGRGRAVGGLRIVAVRGPREHRADHSPAPGIRGY